MKRCNHCGVEKPLDGFYTDRKARDGRRPECKTCNLARRRAKYLEDPRPYIKRVLKWQRENPERHQQRQREYRESGRKAVSDRKSYLKRTYGLTLEEFDELLAAQGGGCAICSRPDADNVDHDHVTGKVRGILCFTCNVAIGLVAEDEERLVGALNYLTRDDELAAVARERTVALTA